MIKISFLKKLHTAATFLQKFWAKIEPLKNWHPETLTVPLSTQVLKWEPAYLNFSNF